MPQHLVDHRKQTEDRWRPVWQRREAANGYGDWLAEIRPWSWFCTITFREEKRASPATVPKVMDWLRTVEKLSPHLVSWVLSEEWGNIGGRFHCHALVSHVNEVNRRFAWSIAFERFGRTKIEVPNLAAVAAHYAAKYATKSEGAIWLGGKGFKDLDFLPCKMHIKV